MDSKINFTHLSQLIPLTIFIVYDDVETGHRIKKTLDHANAEFEGAFDFDLRLWRSDMIEAPQCWTHILNDLAESELLTVIFSDHDESKISPELKYIINKWNNLGRGKSAIVFNAHRDEDSAHDLSDHPNPDRLEFSAITRELFGT